VAYTASSGSSFSVGGLGGAATLVGLLFVAVSIGMTGRGQPAPWYPASPKEKMPPSEPTSQ
jgi:hypothetical protein